MSNHVYKIIKVAGSSENSSDEAVKNAVAKVAESSESMRWFEVVETRGHIENGAIAHWQVTVNVGCTL